MLFAFTEEIVQGGHGTGKTGNLVLTFSRQGKHREFCCNTGKIFETQGKYFWLYLSLQKACFPSHIFNFFLASLRLAYFLVSDDCFWYYLYQYTSIFTVLFSFHITLVTKCQPNFFLGAVFKNKCNFKCLHPRIFLNVIFQTFQQKTRGMCFLSIEFDTARWFCLWNSDQNCITKLYHVL